MKKSLCILLALVMILALCPIGSAFADDAKPEFVFRYGDNQPEDYPTTQAAYYFSDLVKEATGGRIQIDVYAGGVLGDEAEEIEQIMYGGIDFARVSVNNLASVEPRLDILQMPYIYESAEHMWNVLDGEIGDEFLGYLEANNIVGLSWFDSGSRSFYAKTPLNSLADLKGLKIRVANSTMIMSFVEALGAIPMPVNYTETYTALQTGVVDGGENNWPSYDSSVHYEVAPYYMLDNHTRVPEIQMMSKASWDKLSAEDQEIIKECAEKSSLKERELWAEKTEASKAKIEASNVTIVTLDDAQMQEFRDAIDAAKLYENFVGDYMDIVERIRAAA